MIHLAEGRSTEVSAPKIGFHPSALLLARARAALTRGDVAEPLSNKGLALASAITAHRVSRGEPIKSSIDFLGGRVIFRPNGVESIAGDMVLVRYSSEILRDGHQDLAVSQAAFTGPSKESFDPFWELVVAVSELLIGLLEEDFTHEVWKMSFETPFDLHGLLHSFVPGSTTVFCSVHESEKVDPDKIRTRYTVQIGDDPSEGNLVTIVVTKRPRLGDVTGRMLTLGGMR